eukprot:60956-Prymnesium_polylepis.1
MGVMASASVMMLAAESCASSSTAARSVTRSALQIRCSRPSPMRTDALRAWPVGSTAAASSRSGDP